MVYSDYVKQRILFYWHLGKTYIQISHCSAEEGWYATTKVGVYKFIKWYEELGTISHAPGSGQTTMSTADAGKIIKGQMSRDDETTGLELQKLLAGSGVHVDASTALRWRRGLG